MFNICDQILIVKPIQGKFKRNVSTCMHINMHKEKLSYIYVLKYLSFLLNSIRSMSLKIPSNQYWIYQIY